jgi:hypothetical protein
MSNITSKVDSATNESGSPSADESSSPSADQSKLRLVGKPDPFDPQFLRLEPSFEAMGAKKQLLSVPVRKPDKQVFIRCHPDPAYRMNCALIEVSEDRETYLLTPTMARDLSPPEYITATLITTITRQGTLFLWPVRLPMPDGKVLEWHRTAQEAAEIATRRWIRVVSNMSLRAYEVFEAGGSIPDPEWPDLSFHELLRIAFRDKLVDNRDHSLIKRLRGLS